MALNPGTKLGPYEIIAPLGAGGMGEVYRARDTRLDRTVAIKVLPKQFSSDPEFKQRFEREAKTISALNHPHICALYDVGHQDGEDYLVLEFIEGETLSQRLARGAMPTEQALRTGVQIADALDKAHRQGIVHRDLKPGNVMLTKSGAKLLDFGLAKPIAVIKGNTDPNLATRTGAIEPITRQGHIAGTLEYMSPEQVEGKEADSRSDIFALGAVLYEMATGKRAFEGKSTISVASAILEKDPEPISKIQPMTPPALEHVVSTCLAKEPEERWQSAADVGRELRWIAESGSRAGVPAPIVSHRKKRERWIGIGTAAILALAAAWVGWRGGQRVVNQDPVHLTVALPSSRILPLNSTRPLAISPDGSMIVYSALDEERKEMLYKRRLDSFESTPIPGSEDGNSPFFSPDGEWLGFVTTDHKLKKVSLRGGAAVFLTAGAPLGGAWAPDGTIYFLTDFASGISAISSAGGQPRRVTQLGSRPDERAHLWPSILPGGSGLIFTVWTGKSFDEARIEAVSFKSGKRAILVEGGTDGRYVPGDYLAYTRNGILFVVGFDPDRLEVKGTPVPLVEGVMSGASNGDAVFAVASNGTLVYQPGTFTSFRRNLIWMDRSGKAAPITQEVKPYSSPALSPDGKRIALTLQSSTFDVWAYDLERDTLAKASFGGDDYSPHWSPDGKLLAYNSSKSGEQQVYVKPSQGQGQEIQLTSEPGNKTTCDWTPDGKEVVFARRKGDAGYDLYAVALQGDHKVRPLVEGPFNQQEGRVSPDGKWLAYLSDESGQDEVFVQALNDPASPVQISREGGSTPRWARSGNELYYQAKDQLMSVKMGSSAALNPGKPSMLFEDKKDWFGFDVSPDGRFVVVREAEITGSGTQLNVEMNWFGEVRARLRK